jgi:putative salt-induced outer membrane protein
LKKGASLIALVVSLWFVTDVFAETKNWSDVAELSYVQTGGNTKVQTVLLNNTLKYLPTERVIGLWNLNFLYGEIDNEKTAERYFTELRADYLWTERFYSFGNATWLKDQFAGLDARYYAGLGVGYFFVKTPKHTLVTEAGLNYTVEEFTDNTDRGYLGGRLFGKYTYSFTEKNFFSQSVEYLPDFKEASNYLVNSETALVSTLNGNLSLKTSYLVRYDNEPAAGKKKTDTIASAAVVANF